MSADASVVCRSTCRWCVGGVSTDALADASVGSDSLPLPQTESDIHYIQSRLVNTTDIDYPANALHIFAENAPVDQHNNKHLEHLTTPLHRLKATDPPNVAKQDIDRVLARGRSETGGLDSEILVKENCRLINGQMGVIKKIAVNQNTNNPSVIYIKFDD